MDTVSDTILRRHFRQCVLTSMKGAESRGWEENDFGVEDMMGQIMELGDAAPRMQEELFTRLGPGYPPLD